MRFQPTICETQQDSSPSSPSSSTSTTSSSVLSSSASPRSATETTNQWRNSEETGRYLSPVISIQRAWRSYRNNTRPTGPHPHHPVDLNSSSRSDASSSSCSGGAWEKDEASETDTSSSSSSSSITGGGIQMMSLSTPDDNNSEQNLLLKINNDDDDDDPATNPTEEDPDPVDPDDIEALVLDRKSYSLAMRCGIDSDPDSIVSDYSEMADPIKEHLANVQIIQKEDLDLGNAFADAGCTGFQVHPKILRESEEDEEQFNRRLRKTNYLSLAQEFAELKKVNASALPFGLHNEKYQTVSPLSDDPESGSDLDFSDPGLGGGGVEGGGGGDLGDSREALSAAAESDRGLGDGMAECVPGLESGETGVLDLVNGGEMSASEIGVKVENVDTKLKEVNPVLNPLVKTSSVIRSEDTIPCRQEVPDVVDTGNGFHGSEHHVTASVVAAPGVRKGDPTLPSAEQSECVCVLEESPGKVKLVRRKMDESSSSVGEFDIYTVETVLPQMDWQMLEEQLQKAAEEEQKKWSHCGDREHIRRKLAMSVDDDSTFDSDLLLRKPSLQTRLQTNMNLHMCFVNEAAASDAGAPTFAAVARGRGGGGGGGGCGGGGGELGSALSSTPDVVPIQEFLKVGAMVDDDDNEDFFTKQARLQAEAKMALAQVRPMAHMQLQLEKQLKKKSPLAEIVGIPGFIDGKFRHLSKHLLLQMNFAQLQVVVNDLHAQIEVLNTELMQQLVDRDDLHMAQDSMLVDIEDLTGRAQEFAARVNKRAEKKEFLK